MGHERVQLYVGNVPCDFSSKELAALFRVRISQVQIKEGPVGRVYAFVQVACLKDAEKVIDKLHMAPPLHLRVELSVRTLQTVLGNAQQDHGSDDQRSLASNESLSFTPNDCKELDISSGARQEEGLCINCQKLAIGCCQLCNENYCGRDCQISDWPEHRKTCVRNPPPLVIKGGLEEPRGAARTSSKQSNTVQKTEEHSEVPEALVIGTEYLPKCTFSEVLVIGESDAGPNTYWVQLTSKSSEIAELTAKLGSNIGREISTPKVGMYCIGYFQGDWYRGHITSLDPLKVLYIDFGNEETIPDKSMIRELPLLAANLKAQALKIKVTEQFDLVQTGTVIKVKALDVEKDGSISVTLRSCTNLKSSQCIPVSSLHNAQKETRGILCVRYGAGERFECSLVLHNQISNYMLFTGSSFEIDCENLPEDKQFVPDLGELVLGKDHSGCWLKGFLITKTATEYVVGNCMSGSFEVVKLVKSVPEKYRTKEYYAAEVFVENGLFQPLMGQVFQIEIADVAEEVHVLIFNDKGIPIAGALVKPWIPPLTRAESLRFMELKNGTFFLRYFANFREIYLVPKDEAILERNNRLMEEVHRYCSSSPSLASDPRKGQIVGCRYADSGQYYRVQVVGTSSLGYLVHFIDYGNWELVKKDDLKALSEKLKNEVCCVLSVSLAVNARSSIKKCERVIKDLEGNRAVFFKLKILDEQSNTVKLYFNDGTDFYKKLNNLM